MNIKFRFFLIIMFAFLVPAQSLLAQSTKKIDLDLKDATLKELFSAIEKKTDYTFMYNDIDSSQKISIKVKNSSVESVLDQVLKGKDISYETVANQIILKNYKANKSNGAIFKVSGTVVGDDGMMLPGATVKSKETSESVNTDLDGKFTIDAPEKGTLIISYIGFSPQSISIDGRKNIIAKLIQGSNNLEEVVVTGYATQKKKNITTAIETMKVTDDQRLIATTSAGDLLKGRLAGVTISTPSGIPGNTPTVSIRKNSSWNAQNVLFVIDGVISAGNGDFNNLAPNEIESISVLKDAAAAAVYGARAAGGVVVVTTRKGEVGKMRVDYSYSFGQDYRTNSGPMSSAVELGKFYNMVRPNGPEPYSQKDFDYLQTINGGYGYDHLKEVWQTPTMKTQNLGVSGGTDKIKYFGGISNVKQQSFLAPDSYEKSNLRFNTTFNATKDLQFFAGMALYDTNVSSDVMEGPNAMFYKLNKWQPWFPFTTDSGKYIDQDGWAPGNITANIDGKGGYIKSNTFKPSVNFNMTYKVPFLTGLSVKGSFAADRTNGLTTDYRTKYDMVKVPMYANGHIIPTDDASIVEIRKSGWPTYPYLQKKSSWSKNQQVNFQMDYNHNFGKHSVQAFALYEAAEYGGSDMYAYRQKLNTSYATDQFWAFSGTADNADGGGGTDWIGGRKSFVGQANYSYDNKYLATFSFREDGSMNFPDDMRWGFFPSGSVGWVISQEDFFSSLRGVINRLKLRASVGLTGNDSVGGWQWQESYSQGGTMYFGDGGSPAPIVGIKYGSIANKNITWEKTMTQNYGIDMEFLKHFNTSMEYYINDTYDILGPRNASVPTSFSGTLPSENYGEIKAKGVDFSIGYRNSVNKFNYYVNANASYAWDKVITRDYSQNALPTEIPVGKSTSYIRDYKFDQIIRSQEQLDAFNVAHPGYTVGGIKPFLGMMTYKDNSGPKGVPDGIINNYDKEILYDNNNAVNFGFTVGGDYKGFTFEAVFSGSAGSVKSYSDIIGGSYERNRIYPDWIYDSWTPQNPNAKLPMVLAYYDDSRSNTYKNYNSDFWYEKNNYLRLSFLNIGYNFKEISHIKGINNLKLYVTASNLFVLSSFHYWDPQNGYALYPIMKNVSIGLNIGI